MTATAITVDYLIIGAGATGMAFADVLVNDSNYTVAIVDRNDAPGGHWTISYPFVRLHGPSSFYGVISQAMPSDGQGGNLASRNEILDYYDRVMRETMQATGRVTYLPKHDVVGVESGAQPTARARSLVTGETTEIIVRRRVVDASYMNITVPAMERYNYDVEDGVNLIPINKLVEIGNSPERFTVIGAGKTGIDACLWLLSRGVDPGRITWITPRDAWLVNRGFQGAQGDEIAAMARLKEFRTADEVISALEQFGFVMRRDPGLMPSAFRCATVNTDELAQLRQIEHVVRLGRVRRIGRTSIQLHDGILETSPGAVHIDCTADGLTQKPLTPVFGNGTITLQALLPCLLTPSAAVAARLECFNLDDETRNNLSIPVPNPSVSRDLLTFFSVRMDKMVRWSRSPVLFEWLAGSRFATALSGLEQINDPGMQAEASLLASHLEDLYKKDAITAAG